MLSNTKDLLIPEALDCETKTICLQLLARYMPKLIRFQLVSVIPQKGGFAKLQSRASYPMSMDFSIHRCARLFPNPASARQWMQKELYASE